MSEDKKRTPAQIALMNETAKRVRTAIDKRNETLAEYIEKYDRALEHGDADEVESTSIMLVIFASGLIDPVAAEIRKWQEVEGMLTRAEAANV